MIMVNQLSALFRIRPFVSQRSVITASALGLFFIIVIGPLAGLAIDLVRLILSGAASASFLSLFAERRIILLLQSTLLAAAVASAGILTGVLISTAIWRKPAGISFMVLLVVLALAPIPPYIHALTWSSAIALFNQGLAIAGAAPLPATGWAAGFWVQFMALLPVAVFLSFIALASVDRSLVEAARTMRSDTDVLRSIVLPLAAPTLAAAFGFLFILSCTDYSVPSLFGADTFALDIFSSYSASGSAASALVASVPLLLITFAVMAWCHAGIRNLAQTPNWTAASWDSPPEFPLPVRLAQEGSLALLGIQVLVIFLGLSFTSGSLQQVGSALRFSAPEIRNTLVIAVCAVLIAIPLALAVSRELIREDWRGKLWWGLVLLPVAVPAPLIGIGLISIWNNSAAAGIYGSFLMPVFASVSRFAPFAAIILFVQLRSLDPSLFDAARVFSRSRIHSLLQVTLPLLAPGLLVASALLSVLTFGELGATLIVTPPGFSTLAIKVYNYLHYGAAHEVAGLCLVMVVVTLAAGLCVVAAEVRRQRVFRTCATKPPEENAC